MANTMKCRDRISLRGHKAQNQSIAQYITSLFLLVEPLNIHITLKTQTPDNPSLDSKRPYKFAANDQRKTESDIFFERSHRDLTMSERQTKLRYKPSQFGVSLMADGDIVHRKISRRYSKPYKWICEGQASDAECSRDLMKSLKKDLQSNGDMPIVLAKSMGEYLANELDSGDLIALFQTYVNEWTSVQDAIPVTPLKKNPKRGNQNEMLFSV